MLDTDISSYIIRRRSPELAEKFQKHADSLWELAEDLYSIGERRKEISSEQKVEARENLRSRRPIERVAYYASMFFGLQLFVVSERE